MTCNYRAIKSDNERRYGTDIGRIGPLLLSERYADRTHFIFELLQNAEDALDKRPAGWIGSRAVKFHLIGDQLHVSHFGKLFDEADVRGICGIAESTKKLTDIGRFGIGFKSVYAFTTRPEIHSGTEDFAIENYVWPAATPPIERKPEETVIVIPLKPHCQVDRDEVADGLRRLGEKSLLFLHQIEEIEWNVSDGPSGLYLRSKPEALAEGVQRIVVIGQEADGSEIEERWLVFSEPVRNLEDALVGHVEIAFSLVEDEKTGHQRISLVTASPLVVFFPTVVETHLGFLIQGPYRTTPSRDNIPTNDEWNRHCVAVTGALLHDALLWLRDNGFLDVNVLRCLPLDRKKNPEGSLFAPIYDVVKAALLEVPLLPRNDGGFVVARQARLARSQELRDLFGPKQLTALLESPTELTWLTEEISQDRTPQLRKYLIEELNVEEIRPEAILPKLTARFLEAQSDEWIRQLYEFLGSQKALFFRAKDLPLIRLTDGSHVPPHGNGQPQAFLPADVTTDFPTVSPRVCNTKESRAFLESLGLTEPDAVDDVTRNVLPRYCSDQIAVDVRTYAVDVERMLRAHRTDSESRRSQLVAALRDTPFVACREQQQYFPRMAKPGDVYLATERLTQLFAGVEGVLIVDNDYDCLKGEDVRTLLVACGGHRYLEPVPIKTNLSQEQRRTIRREAGLERASWENRIDDAMIRGLLQLLRWIGQLDHTGKQARAKLLWEALADLESRQGSGAFLGTYSWSYFHESRTVRFDAAFVRLLNDISWVPDAEGNLHPPSEILFDSLEWKSNPFLLSKIPFKPPVIEQLAREAGIEPGVLDLLKKLGVTSEAALRERLGVPEEPPVPPEDRDDSVTDALGRLGVTATPPPPVPSPPTGDTVSSGGHGGTTGGGKPSGGPGDIAGDGQSSGGPGGSPGGQQPPSTGGGPRPPGSTGGRPFISYVGAHPDDEEPDPDGLEHDARMTLEEHAIALILSREPRWQRTPPGNAGYDLYESDPNGQTIRWCELKAMTGSLADRPVGLSRSQFGWARERGLAYWLYIVEHAGTEHARIVRIQNPAGKARTFTFDRGWLSVAATDSEPEKQEE